MNIPPKSILIFSLWGLLGVACGTEEEERGALITWMVDSNISSEEELVKKVATLEIFLDASDGFNGLEGSPTELGGFQVVDPDGDGAKELLLQLTGVNGRKSLPTLRLDPGSNQEKEIGIKVRGLDGNQKVVAYGGKEPKRLFTTPGVTPISVPINLVFSELAPRLIAVTPQDLPPGFLDSIAFYSSKPLNPDSLTDHVHVTIKDESTEIPGTLEGPKTCPFGAEMWTFVPSVCEVKIGILPGINLVIDKEVTDSGGVGLLDPNGQPGFSMSRVSTQTAGFGSCTPPSQMLRCDRSIPVVGHMYHSLDVICDQSTGRFEPAPCTILPTGCPSGVRIAPDWAKAANESACQAYRDDALVLDGFCVVGQPWLCGAELDDCEGIGQEKCTSNQCVPTSCDGSCEDKTLACVPGKGCLPWMGACTEDCRAFGGCPDFKEQCVMTDNGFNACR